MYELWTDGSHRKSGCGGWAFAIVKNGKVLECKHGSADDSTNNRMEMVPVIQGLKRFDKSAAQVTVYSDSAYVINCFVQKWYIKWRKQNWVGAANKPVSNRDLWEALLEVVEGFPEGNIKWVHVRGHQGIGKNDYVDSLAAMESAALEKRKQEVRK